MKKAFLQLHLSVFIAGFTGILGKLITLNEILLVAYRILITILILGALLHYKKMLKRLPLKEIIRISLVGFLICFHWVAFYGSIKYSNVSVALVCFSATGFFTSLFEPLILKRRIDLGELFLGLLTIVGIYIIFDFYPQYLLGIIFGVAASIGSSIFPIFNKQLLEKYSPREVTFYELTGGLILLLAFIPFYLTKFPANYYLPTMSDWGWLLLMATGGTVLMFELQLHALRKISAFTVNLTYNLEPVYGIILAFIIFKENKSLGPGFYFGLSLIFLAIVLQTFRVKHQSKGS
ncbi:MAG: EamA family transporter [Ferruginibacter sp.]